MIALLPAFFILLLFASIFLGLVLLAVGIVLLFRVKNKLIGGLSLAMGLVFTVLPVLIILAQVITSSVQG